MGSDSNHARAALQTMYHGRTLWRPNGFGHPFGCMTRLRVTRPVTSDPEWLASTPCVRTDSARLRHRDRRITARPPSRHAMRESSVSESNEKRPSSRRVSGANTLVSTVDIRPLQMSSIHSVAPDACAELDWCARRCARASTSRAVFRSGERMDTARPSGACDT